MRVGITAGIYTETGLLFVVNRRILSIRRLGDESALRKNLIQN